jgi:predicted RNA-binding protein YlqC (UPF0109 family)
MQFNMQADVVTVQMEVEPEYYGKLIGRSGKNIKILNERYGVTIKLKLADKIQNN